jgi:hypothetical protein
MYIELAEELHKRYHYLREELEETRMHLIGIHVRMSLIPLTPAEEKEHKDLHILEDKILSEMSGLRDFLLVPLN